jgi:hypothetical protein
VRAGKTKFDIFRSYPLLPLDGVEVCIEWDRAGRPALNDPFLINECLSLDVVALAHARGHHATHVVFRKRQGTSDPDLMPLIRAEGFAPVTNNARDFLTLYAEEEVHPGLVIIVPGGIVRETQIKLFSRVLDVIAPMADLIDRVVEVFIDERVEVREWPRTV